MTHLLQVLDLVVNGPIKRHVRAWRAEMIVEHFHKFKIALDAEYAKVVPSTRMIPKYSKPKSTLQDAIQRLFSMVVHEFSTPQFKDSIKRSFVKACQVPKDDGKFNMFSCENIEGEIKLLKDKTNFFTRDHIDLFLNHDNEVDEDEEEILGYA